MGNTTSKDPFMEDKIPPLDWKLSPLEWHLIFESIKQHNSINRGGLDWMGVGDSELDNDTSDFSGYAEWQPVKTVSITDFAKKLLGK